MKNLFLSLVVVLISILSANAQYYENPDAAKTPTQESNEQLYLRKVQQYQKLKLTGFKLLAGGAVATIGGIIMVSTADWYTDPYGQTTTEDPAGAFGILTIAYVGFPLVTAGTILAIIGSKKSKSYMYKLDNLSFQYTPGRNYQGFHMAYRF